MRKRSVQDVRDYNRSVILGLVSRRPGLSRSEIAPLSGLTEAAVSRITRELIDTGLVVECAARIPVAGAGRRHVGLALAADGGAVLAICLTLFEASIELVDVTGGVIARRCLADHVTLPPEEVAEAIADEARSLIASVPKVLGAAVVIAGAIEHAQGMLHAGSLPSLVGIPLKPLLTERLGVPVVCDNLGNALNLADQVAGTESHGEGAAVLVHVAIGLGVSLVVDGRPHRHGGDERVLGHLPVAGATGQCFCGQTGCLNTLAAGHGILSRIDGTSARADIDHATAPRGAPRLSALADAAGNGDAAIAAIFREAGETLGRHLITVCVVAAPRIITLAGPVVQVPAYQEGLRCGVAEAVSRAGAPHPGIRVSRIGYAAATRAFAIAEFLINSPIRIERGTDASADSAETRAQRTRLTLHEEG